MYLSAVLVPPRPQREEVSQLLADIGARMADASAGPRGRWGRRRQPEAPAPGLAPLPTGLMVVQLAKFGFVEPVAGARLRAALERDAPGWTAPTLHVTGRLSTHGPEERLHLELDGDVDGLRAVFREIVESSRQAEFMLDRRSFVPLLPVADLDEGVSDEALEILVAGLEGFAGSPWRAEAVTLARIEFGTGDDNLQEVATVAIGKGSA